MTDDIQIYFHVDIYNEKEIVKETARKFIREYGKVPYGQATHVVVLGGDGTLLRYAREEIGRRNLPIYGLNFGTRGFLLNNPDFPYKDLKEVISKAHKVTIPSLVVRTASTNKEVRQGFALYEVLISRQSSQAIHLRAKIGPRPIYENLDGDGLMLATQIGSSGYNHAAGGPLIISKNDAIAVTPSHAIKLKNPTLSRAPEYKPCLIKKASLEEQFISVDVLSPVTRAAHVHTDGVFLSGNVEKIEIWEDMQRPLTLLFHPKMPLVRKFKAQARRDRLQKVLDLFAQRSI